MGWEGRRDGKGWGGGMGNGGKPDRFLDVQWEIGLCWLRAQYQWIELALSTALLHM